MCKEVEEGFWPQNIDDLISRCKEVWEKVNDKRVVSADVERLEELYEHVAEVSMGDWAPKSLS
jgi:hypothetical protein